MRKIDVESRRGLACYNHRNNKLIKKENKKVINETRERSKDHN